MDGGGAKILMGQRDLGNQREGASEMKTLGSRFSVLKGLDNLELKDDARDKMIFGDVVAKLKGNEKMVVRGSSDKGGTSRSGRKLNRTIRNCRDSFKLVGTVHVPLPDFISSLVELINTHLDIENSKGSDVSKRM